MTITSNTTYDETYHSNIPRNFRYAWRNTPYANLDLSLLTDREIFDIWKVESYFYDDQVETQDAHVDRALSEAIVAKLETGNV